MILIDRIADTDNLWLLFQVRDRTSFSARGAFLWVVKHYNQHYRPQKKNILDYIAMMYPDILENISDNEIFLAFRELSDESRYRGKILSPIELEWASLYIKDANILLEVEKLIYSSLLMASDHENKMREKFPWKLSVDEKTKLARVVLCSPNVNSIRKGQLAKEFGLSFSDNYVCAYFMDLLRNKHYDKAEKLNISDPYAAVIDVIVEIIKGGRLIGDALEIAERFLPNHPEIAEEIREIRARLVSFSGQ